MPIKDSYDDQRDAGARVFGAYNRVPDEEEAKAEPRAEASSEWAAEEWSEADGRLPQEMMIIVLPINYYKCKTLRPRSS